VISIKTLICDVVKVNSDQNTSKISLLFRSSSRDISMSTQSTGNGQRSWWVWMPS
jgi:hypothetical protein